MISSSIAAIDGERIVLRSIGSVVSPPSREEKRPRVCAPLLVLVIAQSVVYSDSDSRVIVELPLPPFGCYLNGLVRPPCAVFRLGARPSWPGFPVPSTGVTCRGCCGLSQKSWALLASARDRHECGHHNTQVISRRFGWLNRTLLKESRYPLSLSHGVDGIVADDLRRRWWRARCTCRRRSQQHGRHRVGPAR
jgi:hypothetical protein